MKYIVWCENEVDCIDGPSFNGKDDPEYFTTLKDARERAKELDKRHNTIHNSHTTYTIMKVTPVK